MLYFNLFSFGKKKAKFVQLREEDNLICSVAGRRKPNLFSCGKKET